MTKRLKTSIDRLQAEIEADGNVVVAVGNETHEVPAFIPVTWDDDGEAQQYRAVEEATQEQIKTFIDHLQAEIDEHEDEIAGLNVLYARAVKRASQGE